MAQCCFYHKDSENSPLGISAIPLNVNGNTVLELLGFSAPLGDKDIQDKMLKQHPYAFSNFNMGGGNLIKFQNFHEAEEELLKRNFPAIDKDQQGSAIFLPETYLNKVPLAVDVEEFENRKKTLDKDGRAHLGVKIGTEDFKNIQGDQTEKQLSDALKKFYASNKDSEVVVLQGPSFKTPETKKECEEEHDFVIIAKNIKSIICIESKRSFSGKTINKGLEQLRNMKTLVEKYFSPQLISGEWSYVALMHFENNKSKLTICPRCQPYCILNIEDLVKTLTELQTKLRTQCTPSQDEYKTVVKSMAFTILAKDVGTYCTIIGQVDDKVQGKLVGKKQKPGQGDIRSVLFWSMDQANLMLGKDQKFQFVAFSSSWSTGKTLCMKEMARKRAMESPQQKIFICNVRYICKKKTLLELTMDQDFQFLQNVTVMSIDLMPDDVFNIATILCARIRSEAEGSCWFVDEMVLPTQGNQLTGDLQDLVKTMRVHQSKPCLWFAIAGYEGAKAKIMDNKKLQNFLPDFYLPELSMPLRSTQAVLAMSNLKSGKSSHPLLVSGSLYSSVNFTVPPQLLDGVLGQQFTIKKPDDRAEVESVVKQSREALSRRLGDKRGVPVLVANWYDKKIFKWIHNGLEAARAKPGMFSLLPTKSQVLAYTDDNTGLSQASESEVAKWLEGLGSEEEERDLITDDFCSRGWETECLMVIVLSANGEMFENLVMRARTHVVLVKKE